MDSGLKSFFLCENWKSKLLILRCLSIRSFFVSLYEYNDLYVLLILILIKLIVLIYHNFINIYFFSFFFLCGHESPPSGENVFIFIFWLL